jgi:hypothetical protein
MAATSTADALLDFPSGDWGARPRFSPLEDMRKRNDVELIEDGHSVYVPSTSSCSCFLDFFGEYGCPQTINKTQDEVDFRVNENEVPPLESFGDYRIEVVGRSSNSYIQFGAGPFYWAKALTDSCGNRHKGSHWRFAGGAFSDNDEVPTPGPIPEGSKVTAVLEYVDGKGRFSVTAEKEEKEFVIADGLPPGCVIFVGASGGTITLLAGRSTLGAPKTKSARKA